MLKRWFLILFVSFFLVCSAAHAGRIAYIYGDVAADGTIPSGNAEPYDQMLLTDTGNTGLSQFKTLVESQGHTINQFYDQTTLLTAAFLNGFDAVIFGLHQKLWSSSEKNNLDAWLRNGGGMLIYSDSASGGLFSIVGGQNDTGQRVTNNLIAQYGMQVTVDQANGVKAYRASPSPSNALMSGRPIFEGEGVSPVAVSAGNGIEVLIPYRNNSDNRVSGNADINHLQNVTINNPSFAALALRPLGNGNIMVMFDRQPMWNNGPGSDINERDNREILRRIMNFLAQPTSTPTPSPAPPANSSNDAIINGALLLLTD